MTLTQAIAYLNEGKTPLPAADVATIEGAMAQIGAVEFVGRQEGMYFSDVAGLAHVHRTMIVSRNQLGNSVRTDTYPSWPYRIELSGWANRTAGHLDHFQIDMCQECFNPLDDRHADGCY